MGINCLREPMKDRYEKKIAGVDRKIAEALDALIFSETSSALYEAAKHAVQGGKRMRPLICLLSCDGVGGDSEKILPSAAGLELIHAFTLIHDDVMDGDELRRGKPSLKNLLGDGLAILAGDALFALGYKYILSNSSVEGIGTDRVGRAMDMCTDACLKLAQGQVMDISLPIDNDWKDDIIKLKTAPLFSLASAMGAILGGGSASEIDHMERYGQYVGMAFQIKDDVLNLSGNEEIVGKPKGGDVRNGKLTLPIAHALKGVGRDEMGEILSSPRRESEIMRMMDERDSIDYSEKIALKLVEEAKRNLGVIGKREETSALEFIADYTVKRRE